MRRMEERELRMEQHRMEMAKEANEARQQFNMLLAALLNKH